MAGGPGRFYAGMVTLALILAPSATMAGADQQRADAPQQLAGLFMQSCLAFSGDPVGLRGWARQTGLAELPPSASAAFLHGAPGVVFDASTQADKLVVASADDGLCSAITDQAPGEAVAAALEDDLRRAGVDFRLVIERDDKQIPDVHHREYLATKGGATKGGATKGGAPKQVTATNGRSWRILAATVTHQQAGQAMLTAAPE